MGSGYLMYRTINLSAFLIAFWEGEGSEGVGVALLSQSPPLGYTTQLHVHVIISSISYSSVVNLYKTSACQNVNWASLEFIGIITLI